MKIEKKNEITVKVQNLELKSIKLDVIGKTDLLMDRLPDSVKQAIVEKQIGLTKGNKKQLRNIELEQREAIHLTSTGKIGFPAIGFKKGMMECTSFVGDKMFSKKLVSGAIRIINSEEGLIPIKFKAQDILEHTISGQTKYTPKFSGWSAELDINYDPANISAQDIINLLNHAGHYVGVGAWRPKGGGGGSGEYGTYEVRT